MGEGDQPVAGDHLRQQAAGIGIGACQRVGGRHHGGAIRFDHQIFAEQFGDRHHIDDRAAEAARRFGKRQRQQAKLGEMPPDVFRITFAGCDDRLAPVEVVCFLEIAREIVAQHRLLVGEVEIHRLRSGYRRLTRVRATRSRCTSLVPA